MEGVWNARNLLEGFQCAGRPQSFVDGHDPKPVVGQMCPSLRSDRGHRGNHNISEGVTHETEKTRTIKFERVGNTRVGNTQRSPSGFSLGICRGECKVIQFKSGETSDSVGTTHDFTGC